MIRSRRLLGSVAAALLSVAAFPVIAAAPATATVRADAPVESAVGAMVPLLAGPSVGHTEVPPMPPSGGGVSVQTANITVNYSGFTPQAQAAFEYAVNLWEQQLSSSLAVPIKIDASFAPLGPGVLGQAGPNNFRANFGGALQTNTYYPIALANSLHGSDLDPANTDASATFSSNFPNWYFGTDGATPSTDYDFVSVVLHELGHALGFIGSMDVSGGFGSWGSGFNPVRPVVYDKFAESPSGVGLTSGTYANPSTALAARLQSNNVFFDGPFTDAAAGINGATLYAPNAWQGGSSYSHLDDATYPAGSINSLMTPSIGMGESIHDPGPITRGMFRDMGWQLPVPPGAPTNVTATEESNGAAVSFVPPADGGSAITSYTVKVVQTNATFTGTSSPINVAGLANGTSYTFTVTATNVFGTGPESAASLTPVTPILHGFHSLDPVRILDTRFGMSSQCPTCQPITGPRTANSTTVVDVAGQPSVPTNAIAVVMNVTATTPTKAGWLTIWDAGTAPTASNLNFVAGQTVPNLVTVKLDANGDVRLGNTIGNLAGGTVNVVFDVVGYYTNDGTGEQLATASTPTRILDTRIGKPPLNPRATPLAPQGELLVNVVGSGSPVPPTATAAVINVTATGPTAPGWLTVWPSGSPPTASNLNFVAGQTVPNLVVVKLKPDAPDQGTVRLGNTTPGTGGGSVNAIVDVVGWIEPTGSDGGLNAITPVRILDTRLGVNGANTRKTPIGAQEAMSVQVDGFGGVPTSGVSAVVMNVTATGPTSSGWLTVWPTGFPPTVSNLNFVAGQTVPNLVVAKVHTDGTVRLGNTTPGSGGGPVNVIFDVVGWYSDPP